MRLGFKAKKTNQPRRRQLSDDQIRNDKREMKTGGNLFRRNRTLTGSLSPSVSSANELSGDLQSPRIHAHHLIAHRRRLGSVFFIVFGVTLFLAWLLYEFTASIDPVPTSSAVIIQSERYKKVIDDYFSGRPIERLRFLTNRDQLNDYVKRNAPEVESVAIGGASSFATSQFDITMRRPLAGWQIGSTQNYVDSTGIAFQLNYFEEPTVKIIDQSGVPQTAGTTVASSRFLSFVGRSVAIAKKYGMDVEQAIIPSGTTRQVELKIVGHKYPTKLSLDRPVGEQVEDMQRAVVYFDSKKLTPQYVDVRVSGKAFYQ